MGNRSGKVSMGNAVATRRNPAAEAAADAAASGTSPLPATMPPAVPANAAETGRGTGGRRPSGGSHRRGSGGSGGVAEEGSKRHAGASSRVAADEPPPEPAWAAPEPMGSKDASLLTALAHHAAGYVVIDPQKAGAPIAFASRAFLKLHGLEKQAVEGSPVHQVLQDLQAGPEGDQLSQTVHDALSGDRYTTLQTVRKPDGAPLHSQWYCTPLHAGDGRPAFVAAVEKVLPSRQMCVDQPSRNLGFAYRKAQECLTEGAEWNLFTPYKKLRDVDQQLVDALQERHEMFCITDPDIHDNPIVFTSDNFVAMTGHPREEINGINCRFLQGPNTNQEDVDKIRQAIKTQSNMRVCLVNYRKNGTCFINQFQLTTLRDTEDRLAFFIGVQIDVEDVEILPFPNTRQTMQEMLVDGESEAA